MHGNNSPLEQQHLFSHLSLCVFFFQSSAEGNDGVDGRGVKRKAEDSDDEPEPEDNVR